MPGDNNNKDNHDGDDDDDGLLMGPLNLVGSQKAHDGNSGHKAT